MEYSYLYQAMNNYPFVRLRKALCAARRQRGGFIDTRLAEWYTFFDIAGGFTQKFRLKQT